MSEFGRLVRVTLFGESHGPVVGALALGFPPGVEVDHPFIQRQLDRRRPGQSAVTTTRTETDAPEFLSGLHQGFTTGAPIVAIARNQDARSASYASTVARPGHADATGHLKFFGFQDPRGGGHFGGRLTWGLVTMGALARLALNRLGVEIVAYTEEIGGISAAKIPDWAALAERTEANPVRCPDAAAANRMEARIREVQREGDSVGGIVRCRIRGLPAGLGGYHFESIESEFSKLLFGIPAVKGVGFGLGFDVARLRGSQANGVVRAEDGAPRSADSELGGIFGGLTDGSEVSFQVAFKPASSVARPQRSVDLTTGAEAVSAVAGRHDPCIVPRAVPVVENAIALSILDAVRQRFGERLPATIHAQHRSG